MSGNILGGAMEAELKKIKEQKKDLYRRKMKNYLLQPAVQIPLGLYTIIIALFFAGIFSFIVTVSFQRLFELILDLTDLKDEVLEIINSYMSDIVIWLIVIVVIYVLFNVCISIIYTHRLVGPTIAFKRHIAALKAGDFSSRIKLRKHDAFTEIAEELNSLAETLEKRR